MVIYCSVASHTLLYQGQYLRKPLAFRGRDHRFRLMSFDNFFD